MESESKLADFKFLPTEKDRSIEKDSIKLSVLCYNLLANFHSTAYQFPYCQPEHLNFKERFPKIVRRFKELKADVLCLQEVDFDYKAALEELGYEVYYTQKKNRDHGTAVAVKKERELTVLSNQSLDLDCTKFSADEKLDRLAIHLRIHDVKANSFSEIIFKIFKCLKKKADRTFNVLNTHLYPNPAFDYAKHYQMYLIAKIIKENFKEDEPALFCGDMNSTPDSNTIRMFLNQEPPTEDGCSKNLVPENFKHYKETFEDFLSLKSQIKWEAAYGNYKGVVSEGKESGFPDYTNYSGGFKGTIDYIFYNPTFLKPVSILRIPTPEELKDKSLPNLEQPSDHLPIMSFFEYTS